ncbi:hypothetical protein CC78DRAFT_554196 [Lojkania enalia]|uniref:Uncharacterized protein n=1 Tax=Lojkania enalia TaxID=147567 RepID=A0A9P4K6Q9_9PLEO|nr:hypothetical protein CC78DRAFT_554196 [Didymosphaeria enalia]
MPLVTNITHLILLCSYQAAFSFRLYSSSYSTHFDNRREEEGTTDALPATYYYHKATSKRAVRDLTEDTPAFLRRELSLGSLADMLRYLWFAGANRPAILLYYYLTVGREIVVANEGRLFVKPVPRFLLNPAFCQINLQCPSACLYDNLVATCWTAPRKVALGFLYTYAYLISSKSDFHKILARELLRMHERDSSMMYERFLRAELRLSRINTIYRFIYLPRFDSYFRSWYNYGSLFGDNLAWMATATVGLATERLKDDAAFQQASYGFTVFAILGPMYAFGLVVLDALFHLIKDLPLLLGRQYTRRESHHPMLNTTLGGAA